MTNESFAIGYNVPGYLPEMEPYIVEGVEAAQVALIAEIEDLDECERQSFGDDEDTQEHDEEYRAAIEAVESWDGQSPLLTYFAGFAFSANFAVGEYEG